MRPGMERGVQTDDLIATLAVGAGRPRGPSMARTLAFILAGAALYSITVIAVVAGVRPDFVEQIGWVLAKAGLSLALGIVALPLVLRMARPGMNSGYWAAVALAALLVCAGIASVALMQAGPVERAAWGSAGGFPHILLVVPLMAAPAVGVLFVWLRRQAPTRPMLAGASAGLLAGAIVAASYALTCPVDTTAFVAGAYALAIALCAAGGAVAGRHFLRW